MKKDYIRIEFLLEPQDFDLLRITAFYARKPISVWVRELVLRELNDGEVKEKLKKMIGGKES